MTNRKPITYKSLNFSYNDYLSKNCSLVGFEINPYVVVKKIGQGSFGSVFLGMQRKTNNLVAIKLLDIKLVESQPDLKIKELKRKLLERQVEIMTRYQSQNLIRCFEVLQNNSFKFLVMEYCNGETLEKKVKDKGQIHEKSAVKILKQILTGLYVLHKNGIIHRDLKPQNILIHNNIFKIADFGFSKELESNDTQNEIFHTNLGTLCTMSPQVLQGKQYGLQADIWSIGVIFYYMLFGKYPYESQNRKYLLKEIESRNIFDSKFLPLAIKLSQDAKSFITQCLDMDSQNRPNWQNIMKHKIFSQQISKDLKSLHWSMDRSGKKLTPYNKQNKNEFNLIQKLQDLIQEKTQVGSTIKSQSDEIIQAIFLSKEQFQRIKLEYKNISLKQGCNWTKIAHFQYLRTQFVMKEILQPLQMCPKIFLYDRQILQILYLVTCRCYDDIFQCKSQFQSKKDSAISNLSKMIEDLYLRLNEKLFKYSQKLYEKENDIIQVIKAKIFSFIQYKDIKQKQIFFTRIRQNKLQKQISSYNPKQQVKFTQKLFIQCLQKIIRHQNISSQRITFMKNYEKICDLSLKDVGNAYFRTYVTNLCQKN